MEKEITKILLNEITPRLKKKKLSITESPVSPDMLYVLCLLKDKGYISHKTLRETIDILFENK